MQSESVPTMPDPERRRRRPPISCTLCRKRKIRCNRETPCSNCIRARHGVCVYENYGSQALQPPQPSRPSPHQQSHGPSTPVLVALGPGETPHAIPIDVVSSRASTAPSHPSRFLAPSSTSATTPASQSQSSTLDVESMRSRIRELEEQLSNTVQGSSQSPAPNRAPNRSIETTTSGIGGTFYLHHESGLFGQTQIISRNVMHKTRLLGQSHWFNGMTLFRDLLEMLEPYVRSSESKASSLLIKCKSLGRFIKSQRTPPWPSPPTTDLPPKELADQLVDRYLRTNETIYRILHIPSFERDYEALWTSDTSPDIAFLVQLKLVLAIGASTYDERFSLRASAVQWVYEAQTWISEPDLKARLSIQFLQTSLLLLLARETTNIGGNLTWITVGSLFRTAVYMGLHRDPVHLPKRSTFIAEMRRRLWNTILEMTLHSSMNSGGPPFVSLSYFDAKPPGNFDDDQLTADDPVTKPENEFTQVSIARAVRKTFPLRLAIARFLNDLGSPGTYEETLRLDKELRTAYKSLSRDLQASNSDTGRAPSHFEISIVDFFMRRYILALHIPFFGLALSETAYAFSRKVILETSLKLWSSVYPSAFLMAAHFQDDATASDRDDLTRLMVCGPIFFRTVAMQACFGVVAELRCQLQEDESLGPVMLRPDLVSVVEDARTWCWKCLEAGETNIKGYLFVSIAAAHIEGLERGIGKDEIPLLLLKAAEEAVERCLPNLEEMAGQSRTEGVGEETNQMNPNAGLGLIEDWDFMISDTHFNDGDEDPMSWLYDDGVMQELSLW